MTAQIDQAEPDDELLDEPDNPELDDLDSDDTELDDLEESERDTGRRLFTVRRLAIGLIVAAVVIAGAGGWFLYRGQELRTAPSVGNTALLDTARTAEVSAAVTSGLNRIFSYSFDKTADTEKAAADVLRGDARDAYNRLFAEVRRLAPGQQLVLTTRVVSIAVQSIEGDTARLLAFLDQSATRADTGTTNAAAAQLLVTAKKDGERWVITGMEPR